MRMKDWKESNVNMMKESINLFLTLSKTSDKVSKRAVSVMMPYLSEKIGDVKLVNQVNELLMALAELVTPKFIAVQIIKFGVGAKSPNVLKESCNILTTLTDEFGIGLMPLKEMIDFAQL
jgi:hypothetical protein